VNNPPNGEDRIRSKEKNRWPEHTQVGWLSPTHCVFTYI